jgi:hypothetical protein
VENNAKLTIQGDGSLLAQSAGIGGGNRKAAGTIIIKSGTVTAIAGIAAAGIGGGRNGNGGCRMAGLWQ